MMGTSRMNDELSSALDATWVRNLEAQSRRVAVQEQAIVALLTASLDEATRQAAVDAAHKLAGALGSFGLEDASDAAMELEVAWMDDPQPATLATLVAKLRAELQAHGGAALSSATGGEIRSEYGPVDVVVIDDDEVVADFVMDTLRGGAYQVTWLPDGESAREALCGPAPTLRPRLLLLDVEMPHLDGFEVLHHLAESGGLNDISVVMMTRRTATEDIIRARHLGASDYLAKPVQAPLLLERVDRALSRRKPAA